MGIGRVALGIEGCYLFINYIFGRKIVGGVIWILYLDENLVEFGASVGGLALFFFIAS